MGGVNRTFDARLASKLNRALERAEASMQRPLGRVVRTSVAQGGTTSFWAGLMAEALHGRLPHILVWEYSINDHAVSLEAVVLIVIFGSNNCFSTPNGYATQIMVMAEGKYVFADYLKFGGAVQVWAV